MEKILVTGGAGFIGSHFVDRFIDDGYEVFVIDNLSSGRKSNLRAGCHFRKADLSSPDSASIIAKFRPELIFHFAAQIDVRMSIKHPAADAQQNIINTLKLLEAGLDNGLKYFCFASSGGAIYGEPGSTLPIENQAVAPLSPYGVAKLAVDYYLAAFNTHYGLKSCSMRFSNVYGPRQNTHGSDAVVPTFLKNAMNGRPIIINGDGSQTRDFIYVKDLAAAGSLIAHRRPVGVYNLGTGIETSVSDIASILMKLFHGSIKIQHGPGLHGEQRRSVLDFSKAKQELGWEPTTPFGDGLAATLQWFIENSSKQSNLPLQ